MKTIGLILTIIIISMGAASAAEDSEILQFSAGVLSGGLYEQPEVSIENTTLIMQDQLSEYSDENVGSLGWRLQELASAADKIVAQFPGRFEQVNLKVYDSRGIQLLGVASISVN